MHAQLLFRDTFTTVVNPILGESLDPLAPPTNKYDGEGQSGTLASPGAPIAYTTVGNPITRAAYTSIYDGNRVYLTGNDPAASTTFSLNHNFTDSQQLKIDATLDRPTGTTGFLKFGVGQNAELSAAGGGGIGLSQNGDVRFYDSFGGVATFTGVLLTNDNVFSLTLNSTGNYDGSGTVTAGLTLNNVVLDLNGAAAGTSYTYASGFTQNFLTFGHYSGDGTQTDTKVNEFSVTAVPEPSTVALLSMSIVGAIMVMRRRRSVVNG